MFGITRAFGIIFGALVGAGVKLPAKGKKSS
jgi:hypothetical protein